MKSSGISLYRMMAPVVIMSVLLAGLMFEFYNDILPEANHRLKTLVFDIRRKKPTFSLVDGLFSQDIPGYSILVKKTYEQSNNLDGVTIYDYTQPNRNVLITAKKGRVSFTPDYRKLLMDLDDGEIHEMRLSQSESYQRLHFVHHRIVMNVEGFDFERSNLGTFTRGERELKANELSAIVDSLEKENLVSYRAAIQELDRDFYTPALAEQMASNVYMNATPNILNATSSRVRTTYNNLTSFRSAIQANKDRMDQNLVELYKKYAIPFACIVFVFIGAPLGVLARRGTFGIAATFSLGFFLVYWTCLIGGEKLADRGLLSPMIGMWMANIIMGIFGLYITLRIGRETPQIHWERFRRFIPKAFRSPEPLENS